METSTRPRRVARITDPAHRSRVELMERGHGLRKLVPRSAHGGWTPAPDRPDPLDILEASNRTRLADLVPVRYGRMLRSPFTFYRGAPAVMAADLATTPSTGVNVQACGDAHLLNFGAYASPERRLVFDVNDFDETLPAPWEWDVKRLAASCAVAARTAGVAASEGDIVQAAARGYSNQMVALSALTTLDIRYAHLDIDDLAVVVTDKQSRRSLQRFAASSRTHTVMEALSKLTKVLDDGERRIVDRPPLIVRYTDQGEHVHVRQFLDGYKKSLVDDRRHLLEQYRLVDAARKVVGVGSVGLRADIILLQGRADLDPLFLQIKEAQPSVLERYAGRSSYQHHGRRVVAGQRLMQATTDLFLGWSSFGGRDCYVRQLRDMKGSADLDRTNALLLSRYALLCGGTLARAHARSVGPGLLTGYLGGGDSFAGAIESFARAYADQNDRDYAAFQEAVAAGRIAIAPG